MFPFFQMGFFLKFGEYPEKNLAPGLLKRLLHDEIKDGEKTNLVPG